MDCVFTSEWNDGSVVTTPCIYNEETSQVFPECSMGEPPTGELIREYITFSDGKQLEVCCECHEYPLTKVMIFNDMVNTIDYEITCPACYGS